jgi:hypothetical protein
MRENGGDNRVGVGWRGGLRGQSEVVGALVVFAIIVGGAVLVASIGSTAITDSEETLSDQRAEKAMTQFSSKAGLVALQEADSQQINFATDQSEQFSVVEDTGWMNVTWTNQTTGYSEEVMNMTLGSLVYKGKDTRIAYQGGGVFRATETGGVMISPPEFHFRDGTLTLPAVNVTGDSALGNSITVTRSDVSRRFPTSGENSTNPLDNHVVTVTVKSEYYRGWGNYFEERTDGEVEYDDDEETATLLMVTPIELTEIKSASSSLSTSGDFNVNGAPTSRVSDADNDIYSDSYNSSNGTYREEFVNGDTEADGDIVYAGDIDISTGAGNSEFRGDMRGGDSVTVGNGGGKPDVEGNIEYTTNCNPTPSDCEDRLTDDTKYDVRQIDGTATASSVNWFVDNSIEMIEDSVVPNKTDPNTDGEVKAGKYYFSSNLRVDSGEEFELNTSNGHIEIAVEENVSLADDAAINVTGDGIVRMYVGSKDTGPSGTHFYMGNETNVGNYTTDDATQLRVYGKRDFTMLMDAPNSGQKTAKFVGVVYAPPGGMGTGSVTLDTGEIYGGILTGTTTIEGGSLHYDETLREEQIIPPNANQIKVTFLHVTVNEVAVEG